MLLEHLILTVVDSACAVVENQRAEEMKKRAIFLNTQMLEEFGKFLEKSPVGVREP